MKLFNISILFLLYISLGLNAQKSSCGVYTDFRGGYSGGWFIQILADSTAHIVQRSCILSDDGDTGRWYMKADTCMIVMKTDSGTYVDRFIRNDSTQTGTYYMPIEDSITHIWSLPCVNAYYLDGSVQYKLNYGIKEPWKALLEGEQFYYYPGNRIKEIVFYKKGLKHGLDMQFDIEGKITAKGYWKKGLKNGEWQYYDHKAETNYSEFYHKGKLKKSKLKRLAWVNRYHYPFNYFSSSYVH